VSFSVVVESLSGYPSLKVTTFLSGRPIFRILMDYDHGATFFVAGGKKF